MARTLRPYLLAVMVLPLAIISMLGAVFLFRLHVIPIPRELGVFGFLAVMAVFWSVQLNVWMHLLGIRPVRHNDGRIVLEALVLSRRREFLVWTIAVATFLGAPYALWELLLRVR